jgi:hypothetical protein
VFFDWGMEQRFLGIDLKAKKATLWDGGKAPFTATNVRTIARSIVKLLTDPTAYEESKNKYIYTASHNTSQAEILAVAEKVTGAKFDVETVSGEKIFTENKEKLQKGDMSAVFPLIQALAFATIDGKHLCDLQTMGIFNDKYGVKDVSLEEDIKRLVSA